MKIVQIARRTNISTNTIRKFVKLTDFNIVNKPKPNVSKILAYEPYILELLKQERTFHYKQRLTAKRVFELLREKHPDYPCSYYLTRKFFQNKRMEFYSLSKQYIPIKHNPGNAQADFGVIYYNHQEQRLKAYCLTLSFPYSNAFYCQVFKGKSSECMLQGLKSVFNHIEGVPYEITFDNDTGIVKIETDKITRIFNDLFLKFKNHYNFKTHFCNLLSPNEKANVEKAIHTLRMNIFSPVPEIEDFDFFNEQLLDICESINMRNRKGHYKTTVNKMLAADKANLMPLPELDFEVSTIKKRRCNEMGCVVIQDKQFFTIKCAVGAF
jgi:transposase